MFGQNLDYAYAVEIDKIIPGAAQQVETSKVPGESYIDALIRLASAFTIADSQRRLLNVQINRASQGLPPLDMSNYSVGATVNVQASADMQRTILFAVLGLGALLVLPRLIR